MAQLDLFDADAPPRRLTIQERFLAFHGAHPDVYQLFKRLAIQLRDAGRKHYGAKSLMEALRFHHATSSQGAPGFKINNSYTSRYARMLIDECPEFEAFFEMRQLKSE